MCDILQLPHTVISYSEKLTHPTTYIYLYTPMMKVHDISFKVKILRNQSINQYICLAKYFCNSKIVYPFVHDLTLRSHIHMLKCFQKCFQIRIESTKLFRQIETISEKNGINRYNGNARTSTISFLMS